MALGQAIRWQVAVPSEVLTEYAGTRLGAYYSNAAVMLETQQLGRAAFLQRYGIDLGPAGRVDTPAYVGAAALGAELVLPDDDAPMIRSHPIRRTEDIEALELPSSYLGTRWASFYDRMRLEMQESTGGRVPMGQGIEGPVTTAKLLRGQGFFTDMYDDARMAHRLLDVVTESIIRFAREVRRRNGQPLDGGIGICDDFAGLISPEMWPEFVVPYYRRIYDAFRPGPRGHHSELLRREHLRFLEEVGVTHYDAGQDQYLEFSDIVSTISIPTSWNLFTVRDMLQGTPASITDAFRRALEAGASEIVVELCRRTPPANVEAFVSVAREHEAA